VAPPSLRRGEFGFGAWGERAVMSDFRVEIENPSEPRVSVHLIGERFTKVNSDLLQSCVNELMRCADENACFERGFNVNCLGTLAAHGKDVGCIEQAFGLAVQR
jgi:hypothetical protein